MLLGNPQEEHLWRKHTAFKVSWTQVFKNWTSFLVRILCIRHFFVMKWAEWSWVEFVHLIVILTLASGTSWKGWGWVEWFWEAKCRWEKGWTAPFLCFCVPFPFPSCFALPTGHRSLATCTGKHAKLALIVTFYPQGVIGFVVLCTRQTFYVKGLLFKISVKSTKGLEQQLSEFIGVKPGT